MKIRSHNTYYAVDHRRGLLFKFRYHKHRQQMVSDNRSLRTIDAVKFRELERKPNFTIQDFTGITPQPIQPPPTPPAAAVQPPQAIQPGNVDVIAKAVAQALKPYMRKPESLIAGEQPQGARTGTDH